MYVEKTKVCLSTKTCKYCTPNNTRKAERTKLGTLTIQKYTIGQMFLPHTYTFALFLGHHFADL